MRTKTKARKKYIVQRRKVQCVKSRRLVTRCAEVDEDVDCCHDDFGEDEDDDYPFKELALHGVSVNSNR